MFIDPVFTASRPVGKQKCFYFVYCTKCSVRCEIVCIMCLCWLCLE